MSCESCHSGKAILGLFEVTITRSFELAAYTSDCMQSTIAGSPSAGIGCDGTVRPVHVCFGSLMVQDMAMLWLANKMPACRYLHRWAEKVATSGIWLQECRLKLILLTAWVQNTSQSRIDGVVKSHITLTLSRAYSVLTGVHFFSQDPMATSLSDMLCTGLGLVVTLQSLWQWHNLFFY